MSKSQTQNQAKKQNPQKAVKTTNVLESLKDLGGGTTKTLGNEASQISKDFLAQLLGRAKMPGTQKNYSGEIGMGESLEMNSILSGQREKEEKLQKQIALERRMHAEEMELVSQRSQELKVKLQTLMQEVKAIAVQTPQLAEEIQIAAIQAPVNPGIYHVFFFEKMLSFIQDFKKNIGSAVTWLHSANSRAQKKSFWGTYKSKHGGASFLLSNESYSQRSAG